MLWMYGCHIENFMYIYVYWCAGAGAGVCGFAWQFEYLPVIKLVKSAICAWNLSHHFCLFLLDSIT